VRRRNSRYTANLSRIKSFVERGVDGLMIKSLMRESGIFIEEVARVSTIDEAVQLLSLQRQLASWLRRDGRFPGAEDKETSWKADERTRSLAWGSKLRVSDALSQMRYE